MDKIELTREQLTTILQAATGNVKDFVMNNDKFIDDQLKALDVSDYKNQHHKDLEDCVCRLLESIDKGKVSKRAIMGLRILTNQ